MAKVNMAQELKNAIAILLRERQECQAKIEEIDGTFEELGISVGVVVQPPRRGRTPGRPAKVKRGRPPGSKNKPGPKPKATKKAGKAKRRQFEVSGPDSVLQFVKSGGAKGKTTAEIDKNWKSDGRSGHAYITLSLLVKAKKLSKKPVKDGKGSVYTVA